MAVQLPAARSAPLLALLLLTSCAARPNEPPVVPLVRHWGELRQVLRDGHTQGRVDLLGALGPQSLAVGALADLAAEITVVSGQTYLAEVTDPESAQGLRTRTAREGDQATLLVVADVANWDEFPLGDVADLEALESVIGARAEADGIDVSEPFPFRVEGLAGSLSLHVFNHSCPIAHPDGPKPWRFSGEDESVILVGFHAENSGGFLTHHGQATHTHAVLPERKVSGHLDEVSFASGARLFLPAR